MQQINEESETAALPLALVNAFVTFIPAYARWMKSCLPENYLTHGRIRLLYALHLHGRRIMSDLSEELEMTPRNITTLVDALEREELACRRPHPTDRRATFIELTPRGAEICATMYEEYAGAVSSLFADMASTDQRALLRLVTALRSALRDKGMMGERSGAGRDHLSKVKASLANPATRVMGDYLDTLGKLATRPFSWVSQQL